MPRPWFCAALLCGVASAGGATGETLRVSGMIDDTVLQVVRDTPAISEIVVTSGGGDIEATYQLALEVQARGIAVTVDKYCMADCAGFLFLASPRRTLRVGAFLAFPGAFSSAAILARPLRRDDMDRELQDWSAKEKALLAAAGIDERMAYAAHVMTSPACVYSVRKTRGAAALGVRAENRLWIPTQAQMQDLNVRYLGRMPASAGDAAALASKLPGAEGAPPSFAFSPAALASRQDMETGLGRITVCTGS